MQQHNLTDSGSRSLRNRDGAAFAAVVVVLRFRYAYRAVSTLSEVESAMSVSIVKDAGVAFRTASSGRCATARIDTPNGILTCCITFVSAVTI